jgi:hypothetical protein
MQTDSREKQNNDEFPTKVQSSGAYAVALSGLVVADRRDPTSCNIIGANRDLTEMIDMQG